MDDQNKFVNPTDLGFPHLTDRQLREISLMLNKQAQGKSQSEIDQIIAKEVMIKK